MLKKAILLALIFAAPSVASCSPAATDANEGANAPAASKVAQLPGWSVGNPLLNPHAINVRMRIKDGKIKILEPWESEVDGWRDFLRRARPINPRLRLVVTAEGGMSEHNQRTFEQIGELYDCNPRICYHLIASESR